jgi:ABC-2 type transport system permease protein
MWDIILKTKPKQLARLIFSKDIEHSAKMIVGFLVVAIFLLGTFWIFYRTFSYLVTVQDIGVLLIDRIIGIAFLAFLIMLTMSNLISAIGALYRSPEASFLMASPIPHSHVFWVKFVDNVFYASWATLVITIPAITAYGIVHHFSALHYAIFAILVLPAFLLIPGIAGAGLSMMVFPLAKKFGSRRIILLLGILGAVGIFFFVHARFSRIVFSAQGDLALLNYYLQDLATNDNQWLPNIWVVEALRAARLGQNGTMLFYISMLLSTTAAFVIFLDVIAKRLYYKAYLAASEILSRRKRKGANSGFYGISWRAFSIFSRDMRSLFVKDIRLFLREPNQWSQFAILLVLVIFYLFNLRNVPLNVEGLYWRTLISFVNYAFCGYILATLSVRFVYPSISMEGKSFWSIASSPVRMRRLFWEKYIIAFIIFFVITEIVAVVSSSLLSQSTTMTLLTGLGIFLMSISLTSLATGLGSIFPSFAEPNPGKIASSGGGMICALISLIYVALSTLALAFPTYHYMSFLIGQRETFPRAEVAVGAAVMLLINLAATVIPLKLGLRAMDKLEF